jgi:peptidoglycan/LPS O-acetylase OafA/YrhL
LASVSPTDTVRNRARLDYIDGLRASAALYVALGHCYMTIWPIVFNVIHSGTWGSFTVWTMYGHFAVTVFIVISGFCLMLPVTRTGDRIQGGVVEFFVRRAIRILIPYYASLLFALLLIYTLIGQKTGTIWDIAVPVTPEGFVKCLLLVQNILGVSEINPVYWSIAVEWQIYFFFPLLVILRRYIGMPLAALIFLATGYTLHFKTLGIVHEVASFHYLGMFALGALGADVAVSKHEVVVKIRRAFPWGLAALYGFLLFSHEVQNEGWYGVYGRFAQLDLTVGLTAVCVLLAAATREGLLRRALSWGPLVRIGHFSYSLYLIHMPIIQVVYQYTVRPWGLGKELEFALLSLLALPVSVGVSYLFYRAVEMPTLAWLRRRRTLPNAPREARA